MDIAGGLYRELCETPAWDEVFGSGGRAVAALVGVSLELRLHTYVSIGPASEAADQLRAQGVEVLDRPRATEIVFSYLHPLSDPHLAPSPVALVPENALRAAGQTVLRFGFLEGDVIVDAHRAVFDPQTARRSASFRANGSRADHLALVLNEGELRASHTTTDLYEAARAVMTRERADVLVLKRGAHGALVFDGAGAPGPVPAYRSETVFKIGTGDVFSAWFAHQWGENGRSARDAADLASRAVAAYAQTRTLPPPTLELPALRLGGTRGRVHILGAPTTLGRRFVLEEARHRLREMGLAAECPSLGDEGFGSGEADAVLIVAEAIEQPLDDPPAHIAGAPVIVLDEAGRSVPSPSTAQICADFTTAIYRTAWAALGNQRTG